MKNYLLFFAAFSIITSALAQSPDTARIELPDQRTYWSKTYYNAKDNTYTTTISAGYIHYQANDGTYKDIDTNLRPAAGGDYHVVDGLYQVRFAGFAGPKAGYDVDYALPKPVKPKFRDPGKPAPPTQLRWKILSLGYFDQQSKRSVVIQNANAATPIVSGNVISYSQVFDGIDVRYTCQNVRLKEEFVLSQSARNSLPDPTQYGISRNNAHLMMAVEFALTPANINVFARRQAGKAPVKQGNVFAFEGDDPIDFEDADSTLHFFFPKDYAWAVNDSATNFAGRISVKRYFYSDRGKDYMLVGVPYGWITGSPSGTLIIDPTTSVATNADVWLENLTNQNSTILLIGKAAFYNKKRTLIKFNVAGSGIPTGATVLNARLKLKYYSAVRTDTSPWIDRWVQAHQLLKNWTETEADSARRERAPDTLWTAPFGGLDGTDAKATMESTVLFKQDYPKWQYWNLSNLTKYWLTNPTKNFGVILWATNENTVSYDLRLYSSSGSNPDSIRPKLEVTYSTEAKTVYFLKDHLGSVRATVLDTATAPVRGYDDYDPWGYILAGRSMLTSGWSSNAGIVKNKFTGKEWDDDYSLNWNYFGARYYDPQIGRFPVVDRFAEKYPSLSPYHYAANNPVLFVDANGDSINLSGIIRADKTFKTNVSSTLLSDLQSQTGLSLSVSKGGMLVYATDENGNPIIATDDKGNPLGSAEARNLIIGAINATDVVETFLTPTKDSRGAGLQLGLNPKQIESFIKGVSPGLNPKTLGFGMVFMHEILHTKVGGALKDPGPTFGLTGPVVDRMNIIRSQLGKDYGQRLSYASYPLQGSKYLPFDKAALARLKNNSLPLSLHIRF